MGISLSEALKKSATNKDSTLIFKLDGDEVAAVIKWNTAAMIFINDNYKGGYEKFSSDLNQLKKGKRKNDLQFMFRLNTMIIWALLIGGGEVVSEREAEIISSAIILDTKVLSKCYAAITNGEIAAEDLESLINKKIEEESGEKKTLEQ